MKKLFTLLILLGLLPVTALAAAPNGQVIYVGNVNVTNGGYWTIDSDGNVTASTAGDTLTENYIHYDAGDNTLTLHNATIKKGLDYNESIQGGTYILGSAIGVFNQNGDAELTITLEGTNTIEDVSTGIFVLAHSPSTGDATLTITGSGSLDASGILNGILVQSNGGDATLTIQSADVTLTSNSGNGVTVQAGSTNSSGEHTITLSVEGGSLTASGSTGISFDSASSYTVSATNLTVSNNAIVRANYVGSNISNVDLQIGKGNNSSGGIVFDGSTGTVYGTVALQNELTIGEGETLTVPEGSSLNCNEKLTNNGTILASGGTVTGSLSGGTAVTTPNITVQPSDNTVTEGQGATFTVEASAGSETPTYQWQQSTDSGSNWTNIESATSASYTTDATTTSMSGYQYRCVVKSASGVGVISNAATLTVNQSVSPTSYSISANVAPAGAGTVTVNGSGTSATVTANSDVTLTATANEGYRFTGWTSSGGGTFTDASSESTTFTMPASDVTVTAQFAKVVTGVKLDKETLELFTGGSATLTATVEPSDATNQNVTWQSDNANVATVQNGTVTAVGAGTTTITVTTADGGYTASCTVTVTVPVTGVKLDKETLELSIDDSETLTATVQPDNATNQTVKWSSDKPEVATVDDDGKVTAKDIGDATITVTADGGKTATCEVKVRNQVEVEPSGSTNLSFTTDRDEFTLTATVYGENLNVANAEWTWTVADEDVVALSDSPKLRSQSFSVSRQTFTIKGTGTTSITATYDDGTYRGSVVFTVRISKPTPPDPISYYNIYVEEVCDGVEVTLSNNVVREGNSISVYVEKDTANYTFDNFQVYYKRSYYGVWEVLEEGVQPGEYPIRNIWTHIYIKVEGAVEKEDPTGIEQVEGVKVYTKDGSLYVQTPQRETVIIVSMTGAVVKNEEQVGLKQYHGLQPGIYIVRIGERAYKVRLN